MRLFISSAVASILLFFAISPLVSAQEELRCLPEGKYNLISVNVHKGLEGTKAYKLYNSMREKMYSSNKKPREFTLHFIPPELEDHVVSSLSANMYVSEYIELPEPRLIERKDDYKIKREYRGNTLIQAFYRDTHQKILVFGVLRQSGETLYVKKLVDFEESKAAAIRSGSLVVSGRSLRGEPVFNFTSTLNRRHIDGKGEFYCWFSEDGLMLIAPSLELLESMVNAKTGSASSLISDPELDEALTLITDAASHWSINFSYGNRERMAKEAIYAENAKSRNADFPVTPGLQPVYSLYLIDMGERYIERNYHMYESDLVAQEGYKTEKHFWERIANSKEVGADDSSDGKDFYKAEMKQTRWKVDGRVVAREVIYNQELMRMHFEKSKELGRRIREREEEREKEQKSQKNTDKNR